MAMGKREAEQQQDLFITRDQLPRSPGHVFYRKLNRLLADGGFDRWIEGLCQPHYCRDEGRPSVPPGTYFRMLPVGYFEGINSQRGIAWRCSDSLSLREFLGIPLGKDSPSEASTTGSLQPPLGKLPEYEQFSGQAPFILLDHPDFS